MNAGFLLSFLADPNSAPVSIPYYNFEHNNNYLRGLRYFDRDRQIAERNAFKYQDFFRDFGNELSNNLVDLRPFTSRGRAPFTDEKKNLSHILDRGYYNGVMNTARPLYGSPNDYFNGNTKLEGISRFNKFDTELANQILLPALNVNLPMDIPEVREHALQLFRSGDNLDQVVAKTRHWILDQSGASSLEEFMENRNDPILSRAWRSLNSTLPAKAVADIWGLRDINGGYYNEDRQTLTEPAKTTLAAASGAEMLKASKWLPRVIGGKLGQTVGKSVGFLGGPFAGIGGFGLNATNAIGTVRNKDDLKRFLKSEIVRGRNPFEANAEDMLYDTVVNSYALPYSAWVGPGSLTRLTHHAARLSPEYRKMLAEIEQELDKEGFYDSSPLWTRDERGRRVLKTKSVTSDVTEGGSKALQYMLLTGSLYPKLVVGGAGVGAGNALYKAWQLRKDKTNGVITDDDLRHLGYDDPHDPSSTYNSIVKSIKSGLRMPGRLLKDPINTGRVIMGVPLDLAKYWGSNYKNRHLESGTTDAERKRGAVIKRDAPTRAEIEAAYRKRTGREAPTRMKQNEPSQKKASDPLELINNNYPAADAEAKLNQVKANTIFNMKPSAEAAKRMAESFRKNGRPGLMLSAAKRAFKPSNAIDLMFGTGSGYVRDMENIAQEARERYKSSPLGLIPPSLVAPFSEDARAVLVSDRMASGVKDTMEKTAIPFMATKAAIAALLLGYGIKQYVNKDKNETQAQTL